MCPSASFLWPPLGSDSLSSPPPPLPGFGSSAPPPGGAPRRRPDVAGQTSRAQRAGESLRHRPGDSQASTWMLSMSSARTAAGPIMGLPHIEARPSGDHDGDFAAPGRLVVCHRNDSARFSFRGPDTAARGRRRNRRGSRACRPRPAMREPDTRGLRQSLAGLLGPAAPRVGEVGVERPFSFQTGVAIVVAGIHRQLRTGYREPVSTTITWDACPDQRLSVDRVAVREHLS